MSVHVMPESTPRDVVRFALAAIDAECAFKKAKAELSSTENNLSKCLSECEKMKHDVTVSIDRMSEEEQRLNGERNKWNTAIRKLRKEKELLDFYEACRKDPRSTWVGRIPNPNSIKIPNKPVPIPEEFLVEHNELMGKYIDLVHKLAKAEQAHIKALSGVQKAEVCARDAVARFVKHETLYQQQKEEERASLVEAEEEREFNRQMSIKQNLTDIEEAKKNLAALGASVPN